MESNLLLTLKNLKDGVSVIHFVGEFDKAGFLTVREELNAMIKNFKGTFLLFDFSKLKFINSEGIGYLMEIHSHFSTLDGKFCIVGVRSNVEDIFDTIGLSDIVSIYDNMSDFYDSINN